MPCQPPCLILRCSSGAEFLVSDCRAYTTITTTTPPARPPARPLQRAVLEWNSRSCLLHNFYKGDQGAQEAANCRAGNVQFDLVFGEFSDWPYYPDQLMTIYRRGGLVAVQGCTT